MPPKKTSTKTAKKSEDSSSDDEMSTVVLNPGQAATSNGVLPTREQTNRKAKVYTADLCKLVEVLIKNTQGFTDAVTKVEDYNHAKFAELEHEYDRTERDYREKSDNLKRSFDDLQVKLNKMHEEQQAKLTKEYTEKKYMTEKEY